MKGLLYCFLLLSAVLATSCSPQATTGTGPMELPSEVLGKDWVHAYWLSAGSARVYLPAGESTFEDRLTDGLRFNDKNVYLQYTYQENGERSTEIGNWLWLADKGTLQISFENDKEALNYKVISVSGDRLELEVVPD